MSETELREEGYKISSVTIENFLGIKFCNIDFDETGAVIGGENGAGKTSIAKAIYMLFAGKSGVPADPVRHGAERAFAKIDLDQDFQIVAEILPDRTYRLNLRDKNGGKFRSPQELLDQFNARYGFWPQSFMELSAPEQRDMLMKLAGIDLAPLERERAGLAEDRKAANKQLADARAKLNGLMHHDVMQTEEKSAGELITQLKNAQEVANNQKSLQAKAAQLHQENARRQDQLRALRDQISLAETKIEEVEQSIESATDQATQFEIEAEALNFPDVDVIEKELYELESVNEKIRANKSYLALVLERDKISDTLFELQEKLGGIDVRKEKMLADAKFPIEGLGFNDHGVTFGGVPFEQACDADQFSTAIAIGMALRPRLKLVYVRNGSMMTPTTRAKLSALAKEKGFQILFEVAGDAADVTVLMEDGQVKERRGNVNEETKANGSAEVHSEL